MNFIKRERWTEADVDALPAGEHDYFDRKSGQLFDDTDKLLGALAKACAAFANSGGGHLALGIDDAGKPDGVPQIVGRTAVREWLEQKIPHLVDYALSDFRVHVVERSTPSRIPAHREVIVIDVGDSALAPHQCNHGGGDARKYVYYHRRAGRSEPAPHFYLELLRQRLVNPVLEAKLVKLVPLRARQIDEGIFLATLLRFSVENIGRVAAYKWQLQLREMGGHSNDRADYRFRIQDFPPGLTSRSSSIRIDDTILPGCQLDEDRDFGVVLRTLRRAEYVRAEIENRLVPIELGYRVATETSPGEMKHVKLADVVDPQELTEFVTAQLQNG